MASRSLGAVSGLLLLAACPGMSRTAPPSPLEPIRVSDDRSHFVGAKSGQRIEMWGFNYDHDDAGRLLEDYWADEWETVAQDFGEMKALGANVARVHLQLGRFLKAPDQPDETNLGCLSKLVQLAEQIGLYLDITGLGCYHKSDVPAWYDALDEDARWDAQARFWKAVAGVCKNSPAIFCYDLMNEPILGGGNNKQDWLPGEPLAGKHFVQRITIDVGDRSDKQIARAWVERLTTAIRAVDGRHLITVGEIPWAFVFKGAKPLFHDPAVGNPLDFVSVHVYPKTGEMDAEMAALKVYELGKPLVIEEIFPLTASSEETEDFIQKSKAHADGWISFYWGKTIEENQRKGDLNGAIVAKWLHRFKGMSPY